jgi:hypothetical protein
LFLEVNATRPTAWVRDGRCGPADAHARVHGMYEPITVAEAGAPAERLFEDAEGRLKEALAGLEEQRR